MGKITFKRSALPPRIKDCEVHSITIANEDDAIEWLVCNGLGEEKSFNYDTDYMVEVSWGDGDFGTIDYAENRFGPNVYDCINDCIKSAQAAIRLRNHNVSNT